MEIVRQRYVIATQSSQNAQLTARKRRSMERSGNPLLNLGARWFIFYGVAQNNRTRFTKLAKLFVWRIRRYLNLQKKTSSQYATVLAVWVPVQCSLSNMKIPATELETEKLILCNDIIGDSTANRAATPFPSCHRSEKNRIQKLRSKNKI
jgi:hypothetical protein